MSKAQDIALELHLSIGGMVGHVVIDDAPPTFARDIEQRFAGFCLPRGSRVESSFSLRLRCTPGRPDEAASSEPNPLSVLATAGAVRVEHRDFQAQLERSTPAEPLQGSGTTRPTQAAFVSLMRVLWSALLPQTGGALFHACGLHDGGRVLLAAGPTGAGKTTLARKAAPGDVLSDEVVAVHPARTGDGGWRVSATPFFGDLNPGAQSMRSFPLAGIALLEQRPALAMEDVSLAGAVQRLLGCLLCFETDSEAAERNFDLVVQLCNHVPTFVCGSRADDYLERILAAMTPHLDLAPEERAQPDSVRELVSALRSNLRSHGHYAFAPRGFSMRPLMKSGDTIFVESVSPPDVRPGDVVLYWRVGPTAERDTLTCHRVIAQVPREGGAVFAVKGDALNHVEWFQHGQGAELIGRVHAVGRQGRSWPVPGRLKSLAIVMASLALGPLFPLFGLVTRR